MNIVKELVLRDKELVNIFKVGQVFRYVGVCVYVYIVILRYRFSFMGIYTYVWLYRKIMLILIKQNFVSGYFKVVILYWVVYKVMYQIILINRRLIWFNFFYLWFCFGEAGEKREVVFV